MSRFDTRPMRIVSPARLFVVLHPQGAPQPDIVGDYRDEGDCRDGVKGITRAIMPQRPSCNREHRARE